MLKTDRIVDTTQTIVQIVKVDFDVLSGYLRFTTMTFTSGRAIGRAKSALLTMKLLFALCI